MERERFGSRLGFILISAGCAIGLGNVWRFPYITGEYGGAAFLVMYLIFLVILGLPIMVMEFARHVLGYADANSSEFTPEGHHNVIDLMADQQGNIPKGGTMRLGKYPCTVKPGTKMAECYGEAEIWERHRHRYEFNNAFRQEMEDAGLVISGTSPDGRLVETVELPGRDFHLGAQFHPEFKSRPNRAHPLFKGFIAAALKFRIHAQRGMMHV